MSSNGSSRVAGRSASVSRSPGGRRSKNGSMPETGKPADKRRDVAAPKPRKAASVAIGSRLREIRHERALTLEQLEAATRISSPYLSKVERDRSLPNPDTFMLIARTLDVPADELDELYENLLFERDRMELEKLGFDMQTAKLAAALNRLDPKARARIAQGALHLAAGEIPFLEPHS